MADTNEPDARQHRGLTRRDLLKRGAIVGGVIWAAPVIESVAASPAYAASVVSHACCQCKAQAPPANATCSVDDPSLTYCTDTICGGSSNFSAYFTGSCGCRTSGSVKVCCSETTGSCVETSPVSGTASLC